MSICPLCDQKYFGYGNNSWPLVPRPRCFWEGRCCDECNKTKVIPARKAWFLTEFDADKEEDNVSE